MGCGGSKVGVREVDRSTPHARQPAEEGVATHARAGNGGTKVQDLIELISPHRHRRQPLPLHDLAQAVQSVSLLGGIAGGNRALLTQAADAVVAELRTVSLQATLDSTAHIDQTITAALCNFDVGTVDGPEALLSIKLQLQCVRDLLQVHVHTVLSFCSFPIAGEAAVLDALSAILVKPALKHVKNVIKDACQRLERDIPRFQQQVANKGAEEKKIYGQVFIIVTGENAGT